MSSSNLEEWDESLPWQRVKSMLQVFSQLPTLPLHEWCQRFLMAACLRHSVETKKFDLILKALTSSVLLSSLFRRLLIRDKVKFPAQATIMVGPRQALHEVEMFTCALYCATLAARRHGGLVRGALGEAALAGLLTHLFCLPSNINAPRFLWWTWHEDHPSVRERVLNFPVSQGLYEMSTGFAFSLLAGWVSESFRRSPIKNEDSVSAALKEIIHWLPNYNRPVAEFVSTSLDRLRNEILDHNALARVLFVSLSVPAITSVLSGVFQFLAMDPAGNPSQRSYKLMIALFTIWASSSTSRPLPVTIRDSRAGANLGACVAAAFALQAVVSFIGQPTKHVSTGAHQKFGKTYAIKRDSFGNFYKAYLAAGDSTSFSIEGSTRSSMAQELEEKREALDDACKFLKAAEKSMGDTDLALQETLNWSKQAQKNVPHLTDNNFVREMEATNSVRVARIKSHLQSKLDRAKIERTRIAAFTQKLRSQIAHLEEILESNSVDPSGNLIVPASTFGPASVWYTIRGIAPNSKMEESLVVVLLSVLGMSSYVKALAFGA